MDGNGFNGRTDGSRAFDGLREGSSVEATTVQELLPLLRPLNPISSSGQTLRPPGRIREILRTIIFRRNGLRRTG